MLGSNLLSYVKINFFDYKFLRFIIVGLINTLLTLSTIYILVICFKVNNYISNVSGYIVGLINSYIINRNWTFSGTKDKSREIMNFILLFVVCYLLQFIILKTMIELMNINALISQFLSMAVYTVVNFIGNKYIVFKD